MGIAELSGWLKQALNPPVHNNPILNPPAPQPKRQQTIQPGVPLPTYQTTPDGGYTVQNLAPGTSVFAPQGPLVLRNPGRELPRFDPTGTYNDNNLPNNKRPFLLVPMAQPNYQPMPYLRQIGGQ